MPVTYTTRVRLGNANARARVVDGLVTMLQHLETFGIALRSIVVTPADGTITVTVSKAFNRDQLEHLGLNDDGVAT